MINIFELDGSLGFNDKYFVKCLCKNTSNLALFELYQQVLNC